MSTIVSIHCPHCQRKLKIEDPRLFGKKVKCPGCRKPFEVHDPTADEEISLHLVRDEPAVGTSARWVPDEPPQQAPLAPPRQFPSPPLMGHPSPGLTGPFSNLETPPIRTEPNVFPAEPPNGLPDLGVAAAPVAPSGRAELARLRQRRKKGTWLTYAIVAGVLLAGLGTVGFVVSRYQPRPAVDGAVAAVEGNTGTPAIAASKDDNQPYSHPRLEGNPKLVDEFAPTDGQPIQLLMVPGGINFLMHLRPADLWSDEYSDRELRASLTDDVTNWIAAQLKEICRREPTEIEEAVIGILLGPRGTDPEVCAVVRLKEPARMSALLDEFKGTYLYDITEKPQLRLIVDGKYGYLIHDERTIAICPERYAAELEHWTQSPNHEVSEGMGRLLEQTDRKRLFTVVGQVEDMRIHLDRLFPEASQPVMEHLLDWIGEDIETVAWSVHTKPYFHSEILLDPKTTSNVPRVQDRMRTQLKELPITMWKQVALKMQPQEMRFRQFIGRLPAMLEAYQRSTVMSRGNRYLKLTTVLPAKAAPNLALATLFTLNEAARTDFAAEPVMVAAAQAQKLPETVAERMRIPVDAEFSRTPLEPALQYLCDEIQVKLIVDGDALKDAGYTKNMPQTFTFGKVPMERSLAHIINSYQERGKEMAASINEGTKTVIVTTKKFADQQGLPIYPLKSE